MQSRRARTTLGEARFEREVGRCASCRHTHAPLDHALGLDAGEKFTGGVRRKVAFASARRYALPRAGARSSRPRAGNR